MLIRRTANFILFFTFLFLQHCYFTNTAQIINNYGYHPYNFLPAESDGLNRQKRQSSDELHDDDIPMNATFPPDAEIENDNETTEHTYYNKTIYVGNPELMKKYYVDMKTWIGQKNVNGTTKHDHLASSYRKAAGVKLKFEFPFYGHKLTNLTIATGGFCYVGDQTHSWLAATQYIAPLMANFDTIAENSTIMYGDDGERIIIEWSQVKLKDNRAAGSFTFQVSLFKNGDIWFVYKDIPLSPKNISDMQHPCKLGISDAYLFNHKVPAGSSPSQSTTQSKRIIHEYHRISVDPEKITSNTIVVLTALPTCLSYTNCMDCSKANLTSFHCSWCNPTNEPKKAFCSDQAGLNRRRQEWVEGNCADEKNQLYCNAPQNVTTQSTPADVSSRSSLTTKFTTPTRLVTDPHPESVVPLSDDTSKSSKKAQTSSIERRSENSGIAFLTLLIVIIVAFCVWLLYAFYNPHTTSGQLLIKYRPSKWQIPSSHVRYSASVHM